MLLPFGRRRTRRHLSADRSHTNRARPRLEELEPRVVLSGTPSVSLSLAGLTFSGSFGTSTTASGDTSYYGNGDISVSGESIAINLGTQGTPGLTVHDSSIKQLDASISGTFTAGGLMINADSLSLSYASNAFTITGGADITVNGNKLGLNFTSPGLVIQGNTLEKFNAAVTGKIAIGGFEFDADSLAVSYTAPNGGSMGTTVAITGSAGFSYNSDSLTVDFGGDSGGQGLVIQNGSLESLDMSVTGEFDLLGVKLKADNLGVNYNSASEEFQLYGSVTLSSGDDSLNTITADLGTSSDPGLVIQNGSVTSLDIGVDGAFHLFGLTIAPENLTVKWDGNHTLNISGGVNV